MTVLDATGKLNLSTTCCWRTPYRDVAKRNTYTLIEGMLRRIPDTGEERYEHYFGRQRLFLRGTGHLIQRNAAVIVVHHRNANKILVASGGGTIGHCYEVQW